MTKTLLTFPVRRAVPLSCVWVGTGNPRHPLVCKWVAHPECSTDLVPAQANAHYRLSA
jgi:hypothetical protein